MGSGEVGVPDQDVLEQELEELLRCAADRTRKAASEGGVSCCRYPSARAGAVAWRREDRADAAGARRAVAGSMRR